MIFPKITNFNSFCLFKRNLHAVFKRQVYRDHTYTKLPFTRVWYTRIKYTLYYPLQENKKNKRHEMDNNASSLSEVVYHLSSTCIIPSSFVASVGRSVHSALATGCSSEYSLRLFVLLEFLAQHRVL